MKSHTDLKIDCNDPDDVAYAITQACLGQPRYLKQISDDKAIMMRAVKTKGTLLEFASIELKDDLDIAKAAVLQNGNAFKFCSIRLRKIPDLTKLAAKYD